MSVFSATECDSTVGHDGCDCTPTRWMWLAYNARPPQLRSDIRRWTRVARPQARQRSSATRSVAIFGGAAANPTLETALVPTIAEGRVSLTCQIALQRFRVLAPFAGIKLVCNPG